MASFTVKSKLAAILVNATTAPEQGEFTSKVKNVSPVKLVPVIAPVTLIDKGLLVIVAAVRVNYLETELNVSQLGRADPLD